MTAFVEPVHLTGDRWVSLEPLTSAHAPEIVAASSMAGSSRRNAATISRNSVVLPRTPSTKIMPPKLKMLNGPVVRWTPKTSRNDLSMRLMSPTLGLSRRIQAIEESIPGMAMGRSIITHAQLRPGMSVRSSSQANSVAIARLTIETATA